MFKTLLFLAPLVLLAAPAAADPVDDGQLWATFSGSGKIGDDWVAQIESISRVGSNFNRYYQQETVLSIGNKVSDRATVYGGYGNITDFLDNRPDRIEHRVFEQLNLDLGKIGGGSLTARSRLEQRFIEHADDVGLRFRQQLRYGHPLAGKLSGFASAEFFFDLNDTDAGQRSGFERWRIAAGLRHPIGKKLNFELGYLNQYAPKHNARDTMDHVLTTSLSLNF